MNGVRTLAGVVFWFVGTSVVAIWFVFRDPSFDYRLLIVGSVLPVAVGAVPGGLVLQSLPVCAALLAVLMIVTPARTPIRRTLLGLPLGMLLHLVFTGAWTTTELFWWPFGGFDLDGVRHPVAARGWWNLGLEVIGLAICWWIVRSAGLARPDARREFRATGRLDLPARP